MKNHRNIVIIALAGLLACQDPHTSSVSKGSAAKSQRHAEMQNQAQKPDAPILALPASKRCYKADNVWQNNIINTPSSSETSSICSDQDQLLSEETGLLSFETKPSIQPLPNFIPLHQVMKDSATAENRLTNQLEAARKKPFK